jgi:hypothetical protein
MMLSGSRPRAPHPSSPTPEPLAPARGMLLAAVLGAGAWAAVGALVAAIAR